MSARLTRPVDIALLASDAAIELEELLLGMNPTLTNVQELMRVLPDLVKPTSALMVNQAFNDAHLASSIRDTAELAEEVQKLTSRLGEAIRPGAAKAELIQGFKEFALALSRTASAYGPSFEDLEPIQRFKI